MGLIKAFAGAVNSTLADQWKEFFYCEALDKDVLMTKGHKRVGKRSSNTKGDDNIISNGSGIAVADGQAMIIVEQGRIIEFSAEPGAYTFDSSSESSVFSGGFGKGLVEMFKTMGRRFTYGGDTGKDQRVYYFNTKELIDNKFGTSNPVPFRVVDSKISLDIDVSIRCCGTFSYKISNPLLFYTNVAGNVSDTYRRGEIDSQLKTEFISALQPAFGKLSALEIRPNQVVAHTTELENAMNDALSEKWRETRGLEIVSIAIGSLTLPPEDAELIKKAQQSAILRDPGMAGATLVQAQADAMRAAASNSAGAMTGFMGVGMVNGMMGGASNIGGFYDRAATAAPAAPTPAAAPAAPAADSWKCPTCGNSVTGKFCPECGTKKPEAPAGWKCPSCGHVNTGKFCMECGTKKPEEPTSWTCPTCGHVNTGKFCMECGTPKK